MNLIRGEHKFKDYTTHEEERLAKNLEGIRYNIDVIETVATVTGPGRFEKASHCLVVLTYGSQHCF